MPPKKHMGRADYERQAKLDDRTWICDCCGEAVSLASAFVWRGYYWHTPCFIWTFPTPGKLIPSTIITANEKFVANV